MILADKIIKMRKKNGWSQEELADRMNVSRQAVSKWESAQTIPDLEKILQLSNLFGVTTDYLLKDEIEKMDINVVEANEEARYIKLRAGVLTYLSFPPIFGWIVGIYSLKFQKENMKSKTQIGLTIVGILFSLALTVIMIAGVAFGL